MHYKNGRPAKAGDKIVDLQNNHIGILHSPNPNATSCNGRLAVTTPGDLYVNLSDCLHIEDIAAANVPDSSKS